MVCFRSILTKIYFVLFLPLATILSTYIFLYPYWHQCSFPPVSPTGPIGQAQPTLAPFRLLTLADPQIEGDTRLIRIKLRMPIGSWRDIPRAARVGDVVALRQAVADTLYRAVLWGMYAQKWIDLQGNDLYLAHVFRTMYWWTKPSHVTVLGDLLGSHWIKDEEFFRRAERFWGLIFRGMEKLEVGDDGHVKGDKIDWSRKIMNVAGNHDIGYAGDMTKERIDRFQQAFGEPNYMWEFRSPEPPQNFTYPSDGQETDTTFPVLRVIILNSLTLDTPLWDSSLAGASLHLINHSRGTKLNTPHQSTLLLTHLPLYKPAGICTDGPAFDYYTPNYGSGVKSQNHLSDLSSHLLLGWVFGIPSGAQDNALRRKSKGLIMTGHDHPGCDVWHYFDGESPNEIGTNGQWGVLGYSNRGDIAGQLREQGAAVGDNVESESTAFEGVREITVRSMMGEFSGNSGLLSAWFDWDAMTWRFEYAACEFGIQHLWWATYVSLFLVLVGGTVLGACEMWSFLRINKSKAPMEKKTQ